MQIVLIPAGLAMNYGRKLAGGPRGTRGSRDRQVRDEELIQWPLLSGANGQVGGHGRQRRDSG